MPSSNSKNTSNRKQAQLSTKEYESLGRVVAAVYETGYLDARKSYRQSFVKGMFQGLGGVVGATVLVAVLVWVLSLFGEVPLIGRFVENVENTVEQGQR